MSANYYLKIRSFIVAVAFFVVLDGEALAAVTLQPVSASTNMGEYVLYDARGATVFSASHVIDQAGRSTPSPGWDLYYTSNVTDFDSYVASQPTAYHYGGYSAWASSEGVRSGNFDLDLGGNYIVSAMALWNWRGWDSAIRQFNILLDDNPLFGSPVKFTGFNALNSLGPGDPPDLSFPQAFTFDPTTAHFVRLEILNTWSSSSLNAAFVEVMLGVSPIPESETYALMLAGLGLLGFMARGKQVK
jgi:hypothetical protein